LDMECIWKAYGIRISTKMVGYNGSGCYSAARQSATR
jgi:hypothetical protein